MRQSAATQEPTPTGQKLTPRVAACRSPAVAVSFVQWGAASRALANPDQVGGPRTG